MKKYKLYQKQNIEIYSTLNPHSIKGFLDVLEGEALVEIALQAPSGPMLELGSYCGKSALFLGECCRYKKTVLYSIDHHMGNAEMQPDEQYCDQDLIDVKTGKLNSLPWFQDTIINASLQDIVIPIVGDSHVVGEFWQTPLSLLFIDASHDFESVKKDTAIWIPKVKKGGFVVFHDLYDSEKEGGQAPITMFNNYAAQAKFTAKRANGSIGLLQVVS